MRKNTTICFLFTILSFVLLCGCEKEDMSAEYPVYPENAKLKRILYYASAESKVPLGIVAEYEYDNEGRISKVSSPMYENGEIIGIIQYDIYTYNAQGQLIRIEHFNANNNSSTGFINLKNTLYTYLDNGEIEKVYIEYPIISSSEYFLYKYENGHLSKIEKYEQSNQLESYTINEYDSSGNLTKETSYGADNQPYSYTRHSYKNGFNVQSDVFSGEGMKEYVRKITRTYDKNGNLIVTESKELSVVSSAMSSVLKYEYDEE